MVKWGASFRNTFSSLKSRDVLDESVHVGRIRRQIQYYSGTHEVEIGIIFRTGVVGLAPPTCVSGSRTFVTVVTVGENDCLVPEQGR